MIDLWVPERKLHLPPPRAEEFGRTGLIRGTVELGTWDRRKRMLQQFREPCRSPLKQFLQMLLAQGPGAANVMDTGGTLRSWGAGLGYDCLGVIDNSLYGIVIGTGSTVVDITDYKLVAQIAAGSGAGQMLHQAAVSDSVVTVADPDCTFVLYRNFNNNSGGSITVAETGIYAVRTYYFCFFRDVPTALAVPDGGGCYVKYTLQISE